MKFYITSVIVIVGIVLSGCGKGSSSIFVGTYEFQGRDTTAGDESTIASIILRPDGTASATFRTQGVLQILGATQTSTLVEGSGHWRDLGEKAVVEIMVTRFLRNGKTSEVERPWVIEIVAIQDTPGNPQVPNLRTKTSQYVFFSFGGIWTHAPSF